MFPVIQQESGSEDATRWVGVAAAAAADKEKEDVGGREAEQDMDFR